MRPSDPLVELRNIAKTYAGPVSRFRRKTLRVVDNLSLSVRQGETLGLVGESGCGKSTTGQIAARLLAPSGGRLFYRGEDITDAGDGARGRALRRRMQYVFQDPYTSLNPSFTIGRLLGEPLAINRLAGRKERQARVAEMLETIGLDTSYARRYPRELSGGQRQRIGIARALILNPEFVVLDEPVSALDVSVQAQILNLLKKLQREFALTYLFISHDLNVIYYMSDRVAVMYLGKIVETADVDALYRRPLHPYTQALMSFVPSDDLRVKREKIILQGDLPNPLAIPAGCPFQTRCAHVHERCRAEAPVLKEAGPGHSVSCHLYA